MRISYQGVLVQLRMMVLLLGWGVGCGSLSKPFPNKSLYGISAGDPPEAAKAARPEALMVERTRVAQPYADASFVYKTGPSQFKMDYYNGFAATPDHLFGGELANWLSRSGLYSSVVTAGSVVDYRWSLESNITELYGDYTQNPASVVIEARFFLVNQAAGAFTVKFQKTYRETEPLSGRGADELVEGWNKAYRRILTALVSDLAQVPPGDGTASQPDQH
ncbi:MAG TPA: ABC-type transport auxiliary lipoprotein family protein [Tepidisphaeraceae bacterium]|nr:ABC-type transport auxiliary lipoprotein family protein [Tepidisphaeraceae bacterium]